MTPSVLQPPETEADLADLLELQRSTLPWIAAVEHVSAPNAARARLAELAARDESPHRAERPE